MKARSLKGDLETLDECLQMRRQGMDIDMEDMPEELKGVSAVPTSACLF